MPILLTTAISSAQAKLAEIEGQNITPLQLSPVVYIVMLKGLQVDNL